MAAILTFTVEGMPSDALRPHSVIGVEALSTLYRFEVECLAANGRAMDPLDLVGRRATLRIQMDGAQPRSVFGIVEKLEIEPPSIFGDARYRFWLVPWLSRLKLSRSNQIHGTEDPVSVADVLTAELAGALRRNAQVADSDMRSFENDLRLQHTTRYPKRDHICQYEETDFAFVSRLAEHYGIFYFFEAAGAGKEKVVFADDNIFATPLEGGEALTWKPWRAGQREAAADTIQELRLECGMVPNKVFLQDHNYRLPHVQLLVDSQVDARGWGNWVEYGDHYRTPDEGEFLARVRAEELRCHQARWHGRSTVARLAPGRLFRLTGHDYAHWNQEYLVISVRHEVRVPMPGVAEADFAGYRNSFEAIPKKVPYRPARVTPKPRMDGLLNGRIDGAGDWNRAEIDDQGRYKVRVPFDLSGSPDGKGSQWIRMSTPFGGDGDGMHFPLFPDTEVVLGCVNGDPDRPVILGAVPNPLNAAVVRSGNSTHNRLVTRTGMGFEMNVNSGGGVAQGVVAQSLSSAAVQPVFTQAEADALDAGATYARIFVQQGAAEVKSMLRQGAVPTNATPAEPATLTNPGALGFLASAADNVAPVARTDTPFNSKPGIYTGTGGHLYTAADRDMALHAKEQMIIVAGSGGTGDLDVSAKGEIRLYATGAFHAFSGGDMTLDSPGAINIRSTKKTEVVDGETYELSTSDSRKITRANSWTVTHGNSDSQFYGNRDILVHGVTVDKYMGQRRNMFLSGVLNLYCSGTYNLGFGPVLNTTLAATTTISLSFNFSMQAGFNCNMFLGWSWSYFATGRFTSITGNDIKIVAGLDAKKVDFALDIKGVDLTSKVTVAQQDSFKVWRDGLAMGAAEMDAKVVSSINLLT